MLIAFMSEMHEKAADTSEDGEVLTRIKKAFEDKTRALKESETDAVQKMSHIFEFMELAFGEGQKMLILVTELSTSKDSARFVARYGCDAYFKHNKELLFYERQVQVIDALEEGMGS